jgi:hypothetical protein
MPTGCFAVLLKSESEYNVLGYYFKEGIADFKITSDLYLRLNLDHSKNEYTILKLKDHHFVSYLYKFTGKLSRKALGLIVGVLISASDDPEKLRTPLKNTAIALEQMDLLEITKEEFEPKLKEIYHETLETLTDIIDPDALKESIIDRTKNMLSGGKKERRLAQELLEKIEDNIHTKVAEYYQSAEDALRNLDYERASKQYKKAADIAEELLDKELAQSLNERAKLSFNIPDLTKKRDNIVKEARNALKNENFHSAYIFYLRAAELSKELMQPDKEEEFSLKSKALQDIYLFEERMKKKK